MPEGEDPRDPEGSYHAPEDTDLRKAADDRQLWPTDGLSPQHLRSRSSANSLRREQ